MMRIAITRLLNSPRKRAVWLTFAALLVLLVLALVFFYRRFLLSGLDLVAEATGGRLTAALCLALGLLALALLFVWMLFPVFVYFGLKDLRRRTTELDRTMKLCARHLARTTPDQPASKSSLTTQRGPDAESP